VTARADLAELWRRLKVDGDPEARTAICARYLKLVRSLVAAVRSRFPSADADDLIGAGTVGLLEAMERFDPGRGLEFTTYACPRIRGALLDALRRHGNTTRGQRHVWRRLEAAVELVERRFQQRATPRLIAAALQLPVTEYWRIRDGLGWVRAPVPSEYDHPPADGPLPIDVLIDEENRCAVREGVRRLPRHQRDVITRYYFRSMQLREIGSKLGVSESRVSQILRQAREGVRRHLQRQSTVD
jgi:RNA polymerase sigma factor for flagellar operon FliA